MYIEPHTWTLCEVAALQPELPYAQVNIRGGGGGGGGGY